MAVLKLLIAALAIFNYVVTLRIGAQLPLIIKNNNGTPYRSPVRVHLFSFGARWITGTRSAAPFHCEREHSTVTVLLL